MSKQEKKKKGKKGRRAGKETFMTLTLFIVRKPWGEIPEYSSSLRYKRMELSGDGHESKAQLIWNPVQGGLPYKMKVLNKQTF